MQVKFAFFLTILEDIAENNYEKMDYFKRLLNISKVLQIAIDFFI